MIIDKVEAYRTPEDDRAEEQIDREEVERLKALDESNLSDYEKSEKASEIARDRFFAFWEIETEIENRYIKDRTKDELVQDARETINSIERSDFEEFLSETKEPFSKTRLAKMSKQNIVENNYTNCRDFMFSCVMTQIKALRDDREKLNQIAKFIKLRLDEIYEPPQFFLKAQSEYTRDLSYVSSKKGEVDSLYKDFKGDIVDLNILIEKYEHLKGTLGVTTSKLLNYITIIYTNTVNFKNARKTNYNPPISFTLEEYANDIGKPLKNKEQIKKFRQSVDQDLEILKALEITWNIIKNKKQDKGSMKILEASNIRRRLKGEKASEVEVKVRPASTFSEALIHGNLTQYPKVLMKIDAREPNTYFIGTKLADHYSMDGNYNRGTHDRLKVKTLLKRTDLPDYEKLKDQNNRHWKQRIKKPFENALNNLINKYHYLKSWQYAHANGIPLTDDEVKNIKAYDDFINLYILFKPVHEPKRKAFKKEENQKKITETD